MSSDVAIGVCGLGKCYRIYDRPADRLKQMLWGRHTKNGYGREFWAVRDVSFAVAKGEAVGIIGRNGSGKSTLLHLIAGTLGLSTGSVSVRGRVAALLELGSGMNPEFTGRQNLDLYGGVLGLTAAEVEARRQQIIDFADIGDFIDQPVKTYSSGMAVRLAFAVSVNVDAEIMIVDEALSVGDEAFSRKCFARIRSFLEHGGTLLFVSHSSAAIAELCDRAILMDRGSILASGRPKLMLSFYHQLMYATSEHVDRIAKTIRRHQDEDGDVDLRGKGKAVESSLPTGYDTKLVPKSTVRYESRGANIEAIGIEDEDGGRVNLLLHGRRYRYVYRVDFDRSLRRVRFGMLIKLVSGFELAGGTSGTLGDELLSVEAGSSWRVVFTIRCAFLPGTYFMNAGVSAELPDGTHGHVARVLDGAMFKVLDDPELLATGCVNVIEGIQAIEAKKSGSDGN